MSLIKWSSEDMKITTDEQAEKIVNDLTKDELAKILKAANKKMWAIKQIKKEKSDQEKRKIEEEQRKYLLNKPNMTEKDKENMRRCISELFDEEGIKKREKIDYKSNYKKLEAINYWLNYIEIGGVKRARENYKTKSNDKDIFKYGDEVYFKFDALKEQSWLLATQGMKIPQKDDFVKSLKALPSTTVRKYIWGYILSKILDLDKSWLVSKYNKDSKNEVMFRSHYGHLWSSSEAESGTVWQFAFDRHEGTISTENKSNGLPVRAIFK